MLRENTSCVLIVELLIANRRASAIKESREVDRRRRQWCRTRDIGRDIARFNLLVSVRSFFFSFLRIPHDLMLVKSLFNIVTLFLSAGYRSRLICYVKSRKATLCSRQDERLITICKNLPCHTL